MKDDGSPPWTSSFSLDVAGGGPPNRKRSCENTDSLLQECIIDYRTLPQQPSARLLVDVIDRPWHENNSVRLTCPQQEFSNVPPLKKTPKKSSADHQTPSHSIQFCCTALTAVAPVTRVTVTMWTLTSKFVGRHRPLDNWWEWGISSFRNPECSKGVKESRKKE